MSIDTRLEKLAAILRKAVKYGPDDDNPDDDETSAPEFEVVDEQASDLEEIPEVDDGGLRPGMSQEERIRRIQERNELLEEERILNPKAVEEELSPEEEKAARKKFFDDQRNQTVDMNVPAGPGIQGVINKRREELDEAMSAGDEAGIASAQKALEEAEAMQASIEDESWTPPARLNEDGTEYKAPEEPAPYDRATDEVKNEEARLESKEIQRELDEEDKLAKNVDRTFDIKMDDVLVLADTMYSKEQAKEELGGMDIKELHKRVLDKYKELNPSAPTDEGPEEKAARELGRYLTAEEGEVKEDNPFKEYKGMSDLEKIDAADYVQLYALDKLFTKQLKEKAKEAPKADGDDDEVDYEAIERNLNQALGRKPKSESLHGPVKKFSPEEIARYEKERAASTPKKSSNVREAGLSMTCEDYSQGWDEGDLWGEMYWGDNFNAKLAFDTMKADAAKSGVTLIDANTWDYENEMWEMYNENKEKSYSSVPKRPFSVREAEDHGDHDKCDKCDKVEEDCKC
jgi:hypothetical protein